MDEHVHEWWFEERDFGGVVVIEATCGYRKCDARLTEHEVRTRLNEYETLKKENEALKAENKKLKESIEFTSALMSDVY